MTFGGQIALFICGPEYHLSEARVKMVLQGPQINNLSHQKSHYLFIITIVNIKPNVIAWFGAIVQSSLANE